MLDRKIQTSSAQGVCVGKVLHGMRTASRGSPREDPESIVINGMIGSLYNESPVTNSSSLTTEGPSDNAPLSSEEISEK